MSPQEWRAEATHRRLTPSEKTDPPPQTNDHQASWVQPDSSFISGAGFFTDHSVCSGVRGGLGDNTGEQLLKGYK